MSGLQYPSSALPTSAAWAQCWTTCFISCWIVARPAWLDDLVGLPCSWGTDPAEWVPQGPVTSQKMLFKKHVIPCSSEMAWRQKAGGLLCDFPPWAWHTLHTASAPPASTSNTCGRDLDDTQSHSELVGSLLVHLASGLEQYFQP